MIHLYHLYKKMAVGVLALLAAGTVAHSKTIYLKSIGSEDMKTVYSYATGADGVARVATEVTTNPYKGNVETVRTYTYDAQGHLTSETTTSYNVEESASPIVNWIWTVNYAYDGQGHKISATKYDSKESPDIPEDVEEYEYTPAGLLSKTTKRIFDKKGEKTDCFTTEYTYNPEGKLADQRSFNTKRDWNEWLRYIYTPEGQLRTVLAYEAKEEPATENDLSYILTYAGEPGKYAMVQKFYPDFTLAKQAIAVYSTEFGEGTTVVMPEDLISPFSLQGRLYAPSERTLAHFRSFSPLPLALFADCHTQMYDVDIKPLALLPNRILSKYGPEEAALHTSGKTLRAEYSETMPTE